MKSLLTLIDAPLALLYLNQLLGQDDVYFIYYVFVLESRLAVASSSLYIHTQDGGHLQLILPDIFVRALIRPGVDVAAVGAAPKQLREGGCLLTEV